MPKAILIPGTSKFESRCFFPETGSLCSPDSTNLMAMILPQSPKYRAIYPCSFKSLCVYLCPWVVVPLKLQVSYLAWVLGTQVFLKSSVFSNTGPPLQSPVLLSLTCKVLIWHSRTPAQALVPLEHNTLSRWVLRLLSTDHHSQFYYFPPMSLFTSVLRP